MKNLFRVGIGLLALLALLLLAACSGAPGCPQASFGGTTCSTSGSGGGSGFGGGGGGGGGGGSSASAYAYAVDSTNSTIDGFALNAGAGTFASISGFNAPSVPGNGGGVGMVVAQKQYLYAAFASTGQIYAYTISSSGGLTAISGSPYTASFLGGLALGGVTQSAMITNPTGSLLFISDPIGETIYVFAIGSGGALTAVSGSPFSVPLTDPAFTPMNMATDGLGAYLYVVSGATVDHQGTQIAAYVIADGSNGTTLGALTPVVGSPFSAIGYNMWQLQGETTGQYMIGTTGSSAYYSGVSDNDNLYVFGITQSGTNLGALTPVATSPFATAYSPYTIAVQPTGSLVYSFSFNDTATAFNPIEGYTLSSGALTVDSSSPFTSLTADEGTWGQFDQSGAYLFTYASFMNTSGDLVTQIAPLTVGTGGALTQTATPITLNNPGFWVVTDPN